MPDAIKYLVDAIAAAALAMSLCFVCLIDWACFSKTGIGGKNTLESVTVHGGGKGNQKKLRLAVTPSGTLKAGSEPWDDMGKLLKELGEGYKFDTITEKDIIELHENGNLNKQYDVIFLTCAQSGADPVMNQKLLEPLQSYVANGGILYASDWRFDTIKTVFPDTVAGGFVGEGAQQELQADVVDPDLREVLDAGAVKAEAKSGQRGNRAEFKHAPGKIHLRFDMGEWKTSAFAGRGVKTLLQGTYKRDKTDKKQRSEPIAKAPLMVRFQFNKGTVIFTSFHNEKQNSDIEKALLQYLVFSLVTAGIDEEVSSSLNREGFTPQRSNLMSNAEAPSVEKTYDNKEVCTLRFTLGFRGEGTKLKFTIKSPDGKHYTQECESTVTLEVANAAKGTWTYIVAADAAPPNFAFTVTVGEKK